jgi:ferric-dicitrate binding protein FerR (iron transport regulator)
MRDDDELTAAERAALTNAWPAPEPPAGFAERVLEARRGQVESAAALTALPVAPIARKRRRGALLVIGLVSGAAAVGLFYFSAGRPDRPRLVGTVQVDARREIAIGPRGIAVAEAGSAIDWNVRADGTALVRQASGNVFYRVEPGGRFEVETPAGSVRVVGTCFRVEVEAMGSKSQVMLSAGAGAVITAAVLVTVYEGKVRVDNRHGSATLTAGESARLTAGAGPALADARSPNGAAGAGRSVPLGPPPADDATREQLIARDQAQRQTIASLEARVADLEAEVARRGGPGGDDGEAGGNDRKMWDIPPEEWARMAEQCAVRYALPSMDAEPKRLTAKTAERIGLGPDEVAPMNALLQKSHDRYMGTIRALYVEATGDTVGAESLEPSAMVTEIINKAGEHQEAEARRRVALEKAGKLPVRGGAESPAVERLFRFLVSFGDELYADLVKEVGPERAAPLREKGYGSQTSMNGCDDSKDE